MNDLSKEAIDNPLGNPFPLVLVNGIESLCLPLKMTAHMSPYIGSGTHDDDPSGEAYLTCVPAVDAE